MSMQRRTNTVLAGARARVCLAAYDRGRAACGGTADSVIFSTRLAGVGRTAHSRQHACGRNEDDARVNMDVHSERISKSVRERISKAGCRDLGPIAIRTTWDE
jgi:hypothetical protein